jgi:hypothetical protein
MPETVSCNRCASDDVAPIFPSSRNLDEGSTPR